MRMILVNQMIPFILCLVVLTMYIDAAGDDDDAEDDKVPIDATLRAKITELINLERSLEMINQVVKVKGKKDDDDFEDSDSDMSIESDYSNKFHKPNSSSTAVDSLQPMDGQDTGEEGSGDDDSEDETDEALRSRYYIQFDHIPPEVFLTHSGEFKKKRTAMVALSGFDHNSQLWRKCTTGKTKTNDLFKIFSLMGESHDPKLAFACAIWANLKCIRDKEKNLDRKVLDSDSAFSRYKAAFKELVRIQYSPDDNSNPGICEEEKDDPNKSKTNLKGSNISKKHRDCLLTWIDVNNSAEKWFWKRCCMVTRETDTDIDKNIRDEKRFKNGDLSEESEDELEPYDRCGEYKLHETTY